jgi:uncharacterized protein (TIGR03435 family)
MTTLSQIISAALMQSLWQDAIIALALWMALRILKAHSAQLRYVASCAALAMMVLWPIAGSVSAVATPTPSSTPEPSQSAAPAPPIVDAPGASRSGWSIVPFVQPSSIAPLQQWALPIWIAGVMLFSLRASGAGAHAFVLTRRGAPADAALASRVAALAARIGVSRRVRVITSALSQGPATLGALRPVILVPSAVILGLTPQQLEAVLAHELAHIDRHDFLVNIVQVLIETLFFYHPAVWWTSRRIRLERELCCDDIAVRCCGEPLIYAQALTSIAKLPVPAPLFALGARSGPLVYRVQRVLGLEPRSNAMSLWPPILAIGLLLACAAVSAGWAQTTAPQRFEVASVKPNRSGSLAISIDLPGPRRFTATNVPLDNLIRFAFNVDDTRLTGGPGWINADRFDIVATSDRDIPTWTTAGPPEVVLAMLRTLLAERFNLATHIESRELPVYALVMSRDDKKLGPRAAVTTTDCASMLSGKSGPQPPPSAPGEPPMCGMRIGPGQMLLGSVPMSQFASVLGPFARRIVIDRTGLAGNYNLQLSWTPQGMRLGGPPPPDGAPPVPPPDPNGASLFVSIQEQLGLKLEPSRAPLDVVVIDHVERPTAD